MTSNVQGKVDPEISTDDTQSCCKDGRHDERLAAVLEDAQISPGKMLMQSVTDILAQSAQSVRTLVSGHTTYMTVSDDNEKEKAGVLSEDGEEKPMLPTAVDAVSGSSDGDTAENEEEKTLYQVVGERIAQSALSVKEAVTGSTGGENEEDKTLYQAVGERIAQSAQSMKDAVTGGVEDGEEKTVLQAVGEKLVQSAKTVKDAVKGDVRIIPGEDEAAEHSILVHTALD